MSVVVVCGGRDYKDFDRVSSVLDAFHALRPIEVLIEGGASGADRHARTWAMRKGVHVATVAANWDVYGKAAGPVRNRAMLLLKPSHVIAFRGGAGTLSMVMHAKSFGVPVMEVDP